MILDYISISLIFIKINDLITSSKAFKFSLIQVILIVFFFFWEGDITTIFFHLFLLVGGYSFHSNLSFHFKDNVEVR